MATGCGLCVPPRGVWAMLLATSRCCEAAEPARGGAHEERARRGPAVGTPGAGAWGATWLPACVGTGNPTYVQQRLLNSVTRVRVQQPTRIVHQVATNTASGCHVGKSCALAVCSACRGGRTTASVRPPQLEARARAVFGHTVSTVRECVFNAIPRAAGASESAPPRVAGASWCTHCHCQ